MHKKFFLLMFCLCFSILGFICSELKAEIIENTTNVEDNINSVQAGTKEDTFSKPNETINYYKNKIGDIDNTLIVLTGKYQNLEDRFIQSEKNFDRVTDNQKDIFNKMLCWLLAITAALLAGAWFNNFIFIRSTVKSAKEDLRKEFADKIRELNSEIRSYNEESFEKQEKQYSTKFTELEAKIYNAVGRIYEDRFPRVSAIWYARGLQEFLQCGFKESWIKLQINLIKENLAKVVEKIRDPELIAELQGIIETIPDEQYKAEKEELKKIFKEKLG